MKRRGAGKSPRAQVLGQGAVVAVTAFAIVATSANDQYAEALHTDEEHSHSDARLGGESDAEAVLGLDARAGDGISGIEGSAIGWESRLEEATPLGPSSTALPGHVQSQKPRHWLYGNWPDENESWDMVPERAILALERMPKPTVRRQELTFLTQCLKRRAISTPPAMMLLAGLSELELIEPDYVVDLLLPFLSDDSVLLRATAAEARCQIGSPLARRDLEIASDTEEHPEIRELMLHILEGLA